MAGIYDSSLSLIKKTTLTKQGRGMLIRPIHCLHNTTLTHSCWGLAVKLGNVKSFWASSLGFRVCQHIAAALFLFLLKLLKTRESNITVCESDS
jgi:hypothetical protein